MTDKEYKAIQEWLSKKLKDTPYYFTAKEKTRLASCNKSCTVIYTL